MTRDALSALRANGHPVRTARLPPAAALAPRVSQHPPRRAVTGAGFGDFGGEMLLGASGAGRGGMAEAQRSLQDLIKGRQRSCFAGRQGELVQFRENLELAVSDERRRFLFNVHGDAGVGKSFLARQFQEVAGSCGALTAFADESSGDALAVMASVSDQLRRAGAVLTRFDRRAALYQRRRRDLESSRDAPDGLAAFLTRTAVTAGLHAARAVPVAGALAASVDSAATADQVNRARAHLAAKIRDRADLQLLLSPVGELTRVFACRPDGSCGGQARSVVPRYL